jgi:hypothetical protein
MAQPEIADSETDEDILISLQFVCKDWFPQYRTGELLVNEWITSRLKAETVGKAFTFFNKLSW